MSAGRSKLIAIMIRVAAIVICLPISALYAALGGDDPPEINTLRGLEGVHVLVEKMQPDAERDGLISEGIQMDVELKLRKAGIRVLTFEERVSAPGSPYLYINVNAALNKTIQLYSFTINVQLKQDVYLARNPAIATKATTWSIEGTGGVGQQRLRDIREQIADYVDTFINAYLAMNPRE